MSSAVARQPIVTASEEIFGYELLYRGAFFENVLLENPDQATSDVAFQSFLDIGLDTITDHHTAFINFTGNSLLQRVPLLLPASKVVIEILEDIKSTGDMLDIVKELKDKGYRIALDDFILTEENEAFLPYADVVKVDWKKSGPCDIQNIINAHEQFTFVMLAEKLETAQDFEKAKSLGFTLFQGYYFGYPDIVK